MDNGKRRKIFLSIKDLEFIKIWNENYRKWAWECGQYSYEQSIKADNKLRDIMSGLKK